ncbi:ROK family protein [Candidatus Saccharibacteria bacterium]|nr:ROK family protein [Candidatus Saccharibacteria bacterium]
MYLAIDIGATKTLIALFSQRGRVLRRVKFPTARGAKVFINDLVRNLESFRKYKVWAVVVAIPGIVQKNYTVSFGNRDWGEVDIYTPIKNLFACPIYFENDANLAAIYEGHKLPGRTVFLTFSTGIGGGVVEGGKILPGVNFEPGHRKYEFNGKVAEWEDIAAASAIEKFYHIDPATDLRGKKVLQDIAARMYLGLPDIVSEFHPNTIVLGGPMGKIFRLYVKYLPKLPDVKYQRPKRPLESVIYGCYIYAKQKERE